MAVEVQKSDKLISGCAGCIAAPIIPLVLTVYPMTLMPGRDRLETIGFAAARTVIGTLAGFAARDTLHLATSISSGIFWYALYAGLDLATETFLTITDPSHGS